MLLWTRCCCRAMRTLKDAHLTRFVTSSICAFYFSTEGHSTRPSGRLRDLAETNRRNSNLTIIPVLFWLPAQVHALCYKAFYFVLQAHPVHQDSVESGEVDSWLKPLFESPLSVDKFTLAVIHRGLQIPYGCSEKWEIMHQDYVAGFDSSATVTAVPGYFK